MNDSNVFDELCKKIRTLANNIINRLSFYDSNHIFPCDNNAKLTYDKSLKSPSIIEFLSKLVELYQVKKAKYEQDLNRGFCDGKEHKQKLSFLYLICKATLNEVQSSHQLYETPNIEDISAVLNQINFELIKIEEKLHTASTPTESSWS